MTTLFIRQVQFKRGAWTSIQAVGLRPGEVGVVWDDPSKPTLAIGDHDSVPRHIHLQPTAYEDVPWGSLTGVPATFPPSPHSHPWAFITDKPTTFPSDWSTLSDIPSSFPSAWATLTGTPTTVAGYGITDAVPTTRTVNGHALSANITITASDVGAIPTTALGAALGAASLGADGKLLVSQLPDLAINDTFTVGSQAAMLALTAQRGDMAIRTDLSGAAYVLSSDNPGTLADWKTLGTPGAISSVFGRTGAVTAQSGDYSFTLISGRATASQVPQAGANSFRGNNTGSAADVMDLSPTQAKALLAITMSDIGGRATAAQVPQAAANTIRGNNTGLAADQMDLSPAQVKALLAMGFSDLAGHVTAAQLPAEASTAYSSAVGLSVNATENGTITLAKSGVIEQVTLSKKGRVRLYATASARTADASRSTGSIPTAGTGVLLDVVCPDQNGSMTVLMSPVADYFNGDTPKTSTIYLAITNLDTTNGQVTATFKHLTREN